MIVGDVKEENGLIHFYFYYHSHSHYEGEDDGEVMDVGKQFLYPIPYLILLNCFEKHFETHFGKPSQYLIQLNDYERHFEKHSVER